uniref:Uncharacterized protein n=1 Tax=Leersia perrieri TaxID=77586 RepID=A0A0D9VA48_9ORYZ
MAAAVAHGMDAAVDWSDLLPVILEEISQRVHNNDAAAFAAVCKSWRHASSAAAPRLDRHSLHLAALRPAGANAVDFSSRHGDVVKTAYLGIRAGARPHRIIGCSGGWLIVVDESCGVSLLEPFTDGAHVPLPPITAFDCDFVTAIADDGGGGDFPACFAVDYQAYHSHIQGHKFAPRPPKLVPTQSMRDEFFQKAAMAPAAGGGRNKSYAAPPRFVTGPVMGWEFKRLVDFHNDTFRQPAFYEGARYLAKQPANVDGGEGNLMVVSTVAILDDSNAVRTRRFKVFDVDEASGEWRARDEIGGEAAVVVGIGHGEVVSTTEYPCVKPNCVYYVLKSFAADFEEDEDSVEEEGCSRYESGVCDLKTGVASRTSVFRRATGGHPVWFVPSSTAASRR